MADPSKNSADEKSGVPSEQAGFGSLDVEAGLAAAYGRHAELEKKPDRPRSFYQPGEIISDKFRLIEPIGEGGMGTVWYAEQTAPIKRKVALKLIKPGLDSRTVLARFDAERQALALMDHPNIARVFDGGITDRGHPFFVMELVKGVPLTDYCDRVQFAVQQRLELFTQVCSAVQHAHQKGIIHRDLKPSNILVTEYDGKPICKVIDFGLAKALHGVNTLNDLSLHTAFGAVIGTPLYMAPEQLGVSAQDVDTRSDLYSLGVILYELLTGTTPIERQRLKGVVWDEIRRIVRDEEPPLPSLRLSSSDTLPSVAALRHIEPARLTKLVRGELDWIIMKALEKDRNRRYETAIGLSMDLQRYLAGEVVLAAPPSRLYRVRKFVRRNRSSVIAASLVLLSLIGGMAGTTYGLFRARDEQRNAEEQESLAKTQQIRAEQREQDAIDAVKRFGDSVSNNPDLKNNPSLESLRKTLLQEPLSFFQSLRTRLQSDPDTRPESLSRLAAAASDLASLTNEIGDKQNSLKAYRESIDIYQKLIDEHPADTGFQCGLAQSHNNIGKLLSETGEPAKALAAYEKALEILEQLAEANPTVTKFQSELSLSHNNIGILLDQTGEPAKALAAYEKALEIRERLVQANPTITEFQSRLAASYHNLGTLLRSTGELAKALAAYEKAREIREPLAQANPTVAEFQSDLARSYNTIGVVLSETGEPAKALSAYEKAIEIRERLVQANPTITEFQSRLALSHNNIGWLLSETGEKAKALAAYEKAIEIQTRLAEANPTVTKFQSELSLSHNNIGILFDQTSEPAKALAAYEKALEVRERLVQANPTITEFQSDLGTTLNNVALIEIDNSQFDKARMHLLDAIRWQKQALTSNPAHPTYRGFLKDHYRNLLKALVGLPDNDLRLEAQRGLAELAELAARDPAFKEIDRRIEEVVAGAATTGVEELLAFAQRCSDTQRFAQAARFWNQALDADPLLAESRQPGHAYNAARAAAIAGCGEGVNDLPPSDEAKLRGQALHWLLSELDTWKKHLENASVVQRRIVVLKLHHWQTDPDLSGVRGEAINKLPESERAKWKSLWQSAAEIIEQAKSVSEGNESDH